MPQMLWGIVLALLFGIVGGAHSVDKNTVEKVFVPQLGSKKLDFVDSKDDLHHRFF